MRHLESPVRVEILRVEVLAITMNISTCPSTLHRPTKHAELSNSNNKSGETRRTGRPILRSRLSASKSVPGSRRSAIIGGRTRGVNRRVNTGIRWFDKYGKYVSHSRHDPGVRGERLGNFEIGRTIDPDWPNSPASLHARVIPAALPSGDFHFPRVPASIRSVAGDDDRSFNPTHRAASRPGAE